MYLIFLGPTSCGSHLDLENPCVTNGKENSVIDKFPSHASYQKKKKFQVMHLYMNQLVISLILQNLREQKEIQTTEVSLIPREDIYPFFFFP